LRYDVYAHYVLTLFTDNELNYVSKAKLAQGLEVNANGQCISGSPCVPLDVFSGFGGLTPEMEHFATTSAIQDGFTQEQIIHGDITGDLGAWGGKSPWAKNPIGINFGAEYRNEELYFNPDAAIGSGDLSGFGGATPAVPRSGFNVTEGFAELQVPVIEDMPYAESLSLNGGYRYSSYDLAGNVTSYKYGAEYQPIDDIRVRASYQRAVRAPNVLELFAPHTVGLFGGADPCASSTITQVVAHNCETAGGFPLAQVPASFIGSPLLACIAGQCDRETGGNITLRPEKSDTRSVGFVFTPTFFSGFTATVDYFDIYISQYLGTAGGINPNVILASCYGQSATPGSQAAACALIHRDAGHTIATQAGFVVDLSTNQGSAQTKGFDFEANYTVNFDDLQLPGWGGLAFNFFGSWEQKLTVFPITGFTASYNCAGLYGYTCGSPTPRWRHKLRMTWTSPWDFDLSLDWRHISGVNLDSNTANPLLNGACGGTSTSPAPCPDIKDNHLSSFNYFDISGDWNIREGISMRAGLNNMFDKEPPFVFSGIAGPSQFGNGNTFPGTYDALGREIFVGLTIKY
jgi:outer membrane receptor protein involved in Fe transport